ncbi:MAG: lytic transglycosylase domain-containing protein [Microscillaceae bacterium]|nr:lytic transglycosylase domain-containing protein [Microscillaceae bacterium]MDW8461516.1 lytic transglycosylase domain-containing protein [Cytophagales bacterium]
MRNFFVFLLILLNLTLLAWIASEKVEWQKWLRKTAYFKNFQPKQNKNKIAQECSFESNALPLIQWELPKQFAFAQEPLPLDNPIVRRRLYKELVAVAYSHAITTLNLQRAKYWFPQISPILEKYQIPDDFKYIAVIESNLQNLISPADARGFWQFLAGTAKEYDLEVSPEVDERYHPLKATEAACKYFKSAYKAFGSWACVAASYNMGMAALKNVIETQKQSNYYRLHLNDETARYLYRAVATKMIFENPEKYGYKDGIPDFYPSNETYQTITIRQTIPNLAEFAIQNNTDLMTLKELNPWLRGNTLTIVPPKTYEILLPKP